MVASDYDVVVIGGGSAGLAAGCFSARAGARTIVLEREIFGGQLINADELTTYIGLPDGILGADLSVQMRSHAMKFGCEMAMAGATSLRRSGERFVIATEDGSYRAKAVVLASGTDAKKLGVPGEEEFYGQGVSYCATCDGAFFQDQEVAVVGGGDAALEEGLVLTRYASKVVVIHRREQLRAAEALQRQARSEPKLEFVWNSTVEAIEGSDQVEGVRIRNLVTQESALRPLAGVFPFIGRVPNSQLAGDLVELTPEGHVRTDASLQTRTPGLFAAGEVRAGCLAETIATAGDGATAGVHAARYARGLAGR